MSTQTVSRFTHLPVQIYIRPHSITLVAFAKQLTNETISSVCLSFSLSVFSLYFPPSVSGLPCRIFRLPPQWLAWILMLEVVINMYEHIRNLGKARQKWQTHYIKTYMRIWSPSLPISLCITWSPNILMLVINFFHQLLLVIKYAITFFVATLF